MEFQWHGEVPAETGLRAELAWWRSLEQAPCAAERERLLVWEAEEPSIVLPRSGAVESHLSRPALMPVLRRESGGGAVVVGPGCLSYAVVVSLVRRPSLADVEQSYARILGMLVRALRLRGAKTIGSDLVLGDRKFGGSAQRRGRHALLHHGTILYGFDASLMAVLREPQRRPAYRRGRGHADFVCNAPLGREEVLDRLGAFARVL